MTRPEFLKHLREACAEILEKDCSQVNERDELTNIGLDSMGCIDLVTSMEQRLGLLIPDGFLEGVKTVGHLLDVVEKCDGNPTYWTPDRRASPP